MKTFWRWVALLFSVLLSIPGTGQNSEQKFEEVVITGVSTKTRIRENPLSIVSISAKKLDQATESNVIDALVKNVPGLNAVKTGPNISKPFIRGLGYNRVLTLYDGMRQEGQQWGDEHGIEVDPYNLTKAEVIKGPASLMFGSDALAGVVSLIPFTPMNTDQRVQGKVTSEYQSNNGLIGNGFRINYGNKRWAYVLSSSHRAARNYSNEVDGKVYNTGFREVNLTTGIRYTRSTGYSTLNFTWYDNLQGIPDGTRDSLSRQFTKQVYEGILDNIKNRPIAPSDELNRYALSPLTQHIEHYRVYSNNHYQMGKAEVDLMLAWQQNIRREYNHPTVPQQAGMYVKLNTINYGVRVNGPKIWNTDFSLGVNGMVQRNTNRNATDFPIPDYTLVDAGMYLFGKWKREGWTVSGGIRSDLRFLSGGDFYVIRDTVNGFDRHVSGAETTGAYLQFPGFAKMFNGTSVSLGVTCQLNEKISLKANIARGYRAPGITEFASNGLDPGAHIVYLGNRTFVPEFSWQEDLEAEYVLPDFSVSWSVFNNHISNYIYLTQLTDASGNPFINAQGNKTYQYQQASAQLYGTEGSLLIHPQFWPGFSFDHSVSLLYGYNRKEAFKDKGLNGEYLPLIPPLRILSSIHQDLKRKGKRISLVGINLEADVNGSQYRFLALNNTETVTPAYTLINSGIHSTVKISDHSTVQLFFQINNLMNVSYQSHLSRLKYFEYYATSSNGNRGIYGMGRNGCLKIIVSF